MAGTTGMADSTAGMVAASGLATRFLLAAAA
jgi:hypothetical protein